MPGVPTFQNRHILTMQEEEEVVSNCHSKASHFTTLFVAEVVYDLEISFLTVRMFPDTLVFGYSKAQMQKLHQRGCNRAKRTFSISSNTLFLGKTDMPFLCITHVGIKKIGNPSGSHQHSFLMIA